MTHARTRAMFRNSLDMEPANDRRCDPVGTALNAFNDVLQGAGKGSALKAFIHQDDYGFWFWRSDDGLESDRTQFRESAENDARHLGYEPVDGLAAEDEDFEPTDLPADPDFGFERQDSIAEKVASDVADGDGWEADEGDE